MDVVGYRYSGEPPVEELIEKAGEMGYDGVELVYNDFTLDPLKIGREERRRYVETAESVGVEITSVASGVGWRNNLGSPDAKVRERGIKYVKLGVDLAVDLGARVVLVVPGAAKPDIPYDVVYETAVKSLKELARYAEDAGVVLGVENVWNKFLYSPLEFKRFLEDVGSDHVKAYFDVGNVVAFGYPENWIQLLGDHIAMVHVKDFDVEVGNVKGFRHVERGSVDWSHVLKLLKEVGYDGYLTVECPPEFYPELEKPKYPEDGYRAARENLETLRQLLAKI